MVQQAWSIFPNPAKTQFLLHLNSKPANGTQAQIIDALGRVVKTVQLSSAESTIYISDLKAGNYQVSIQGSVQSLVVLP